ncbi:MAG: hypothetical protein SPL08_05375 [Pseudomonadota bacterium]|nr:hypothetical protein [Pseudomonadota bacterium]
MITILTFLSALWISGKAFANPACAVCTVAIGASLSIARKMGVKDEVVGVWTGAMLAILGYWVIRWFDKKEWHFAHRDELLMIASLSSVGFIYIGELVYNPILYLGFLYVDSFLFATLIGAVGFIGGMNFYEWMKTHNGGHAHFPFEKVVVPVLTVFILSLLFHYYPSFGCIGGF